MSYADDVFEPPVKVGIAPVAPPYPQTPEQTLGPIPARIVRGIKNEQVREDDFIVLKALYQGNPNPHISWYKNQQPLIMSQRHTTHVDEMKKLCALKIRNAKPDDAGLYTVVVSNPFGSDDSSAHVGVLGPDDGKPATPRIPSTSVPTPLARMPTELPAHQPEKSAPPRIIKHMAPETQVNEGEHIVISCVVEGVPTPNITYLKNDQPVPASARIKTNHNVNTGVVTMRLDDANVYDAGAFKIRAENPFGKAETAGVIYVNPTSVIDSRPVVDPNAFKYLPHQPQQPHEMATEQLQPPNFVVGLPANVKIREGEPVKLMCHVEGHPKPSVR